MNCQNMAMREGSSRIGSHARLPTIRSESRHGVPCGAGASDVDTVPSNDGDGGTAGLATPPRRDASERISAPEPASAAAVTCATGTGHSAGASAGVVGFDADADSTLQQQFLAHMNVDHKGGPSRPPVTLPLVESADYIQVEDS